MIKIAIVGAPSTGKTILARHLANTLGMQGYKTDNVLKYAPTYLFRYIKPVFSIFYPKILKAFKYIRRSKQSNNYFFKEFLIYS